jgi:hypothetical protein
MYFCNRSISNLLVPYAFNQVQWNMHCAKHASHPTQHCKKKTVYSSSTANRAAPLEVYLQSRVVSEYVPRYYLTVCSWIGTNLETTAYASVTVANIKHPHRPITSFSLLYTVFDLLSRCYRFFQSTAATHIHRMTKNKSRYSLLLHGTYAL